MTVFYRSRDVLITDEAFVFRGADPARIYRIADFDSVGMVRAPARLAGALLRRRGGPSWELHAQVHGIDVVLYAERDGQTFRQVARGLVRAMEAASPGWRAYELAGQSR